MPDQGKLSLKELTLKLVMLIALTKAARPQTIHLLSVKNLKKTSQMFTLSLAHLQKHDRPGTQLKSVNIEIYPNDKSLCTYTHLEEYLKRTSSVRNSEERLFISYIKPHKRVSKDTIRRWIHHTLKNAGINTELFGPYSTRSASVSKAAKLNIPIQQIMKTAGWARESTFAKFYHKKVIPGKTFSDTLLNVSARM